MQTESVVPQKNIQPKKEQKKFVLPHFQIYEPIQIRPVQRSRGERKRSAGEELRGNSQDETEASLAPQKS